jgi:hypothetical protein
MKTTVDKRLTSGERQLLKGLVGCVFREYRCDEFHFRPAVYQIVGFYIDDKIFAIENKTQVLNYFGSQEDVSVLTVSEVLNDEIGSHVEGGKQVAIPINQRIEDIKIIDDVHTMIKEDEIVFEFAFTKAIVFVLPDKKIVFEKDVWMSEDVFIYRGRDAEDKISSPDKDLEEGDDCTFTGNRMTTSLSC